MALTENEMDRIAQLVFEKLVNYYKENEQESINQYVVYDEFGNSSSVNEKEFYYYELERLYHLEKKYVDNEEYEKADMIKNKIRQIKVRLSKL